MRLSSKAALLRPGTTWGDAAAQNMTFRSADTWIPGWAVLQNTQRVTVERHSCRRGSKQAALIPKGVADLLEQHCDVSCHVPMPNGHAAVIWVHTKVGFQQSVDGAVGLQPQRAASKGFNEQLCIKAPNFWAPQALLPLVLVPKGSVRVLCILLLSDVQKLQRIGARMSSNGPFKHVQEGKYLETLVLSAPVCKDGSNHGIQRHEPTCTAGSSRHVHWHVAVRSFMPGCTA